MLEESDLQKLEDLDPLQTEGFKTHAKLNLPMRIVYTDELGREVIDQQELTMQVLARWLKSTHYKDKDPLSLETLKLCITSEEDLYLNFASK